MEDGGENIDPSPDVEESKKIEVEQTQNQETEDAKNAATEDPKQTEANKSKRDKRDHIYEEQPIIYDEDGNAVTDVSADYVWEIGDVEADFRALEQAIIRDNAEENLMHAERLEILDAYAAQRRSLLPDVHMFISGTVVWSLIFVGLKNLLLRRSSSNLAQLAGRRLMTLPWDIHFWLVVVVAPILFLQRKRAMLDEPPPLPYLLRGLTPEYLKQVKDWEDPETSCKDYVLCLAEQWVSAVKGMAAFGAFIMVCAAALRLPNRLVAVPIYSPFTVALVQFVTRIGAVVSLFQFPELLFKLQRSQQPRPAKAEVARLQGLTQSLLRWSMPIGLASDFSQLLIVLRGRDLVAFCGMCVAVLSALEIRYNQSRKPRPSGPMQKRIGKATKAVGKALEFVVTTGVPSALMIAAATYTIFSFWKPRSLSAFPMIPWLHLIASGALLLALIRPIWHIVAFVRLLDIVYSHDMSLATDPEVMRKTLNNPEEQEKRYNWRCRLKWRTPERVNILFERAWQNYWRWFYLSGSVRDKLMKEQIAKRKEEERQRRSDSESELMKMKILERIKREMANEPTGTPKPDRRLWKKRAMDLLADVFQREYETGGPYSSQLGVALQQRLGIGLAFEKEHTRRLEAGEVPSAWRLQSRAVKSVIEHVNQRWKEKNLEKSRIEKEIKDPKEQKEKLKEIDRKMKTEFEYLAKRLTDLTPTRNTGKGKGTSFDFLKGFVKPVMVGGKRILIASNDGNEKRSTTVDELMKWHSVEVLGEESQSTNSSEYHDYGADRDGFLEAYLKQKFRGFNKTVAAGEEGKDDSEDDETGGGADMRTILV